MKIFHEAHETHIFEQKGETDCRKPRSQRPTNVSDVGGTSQSIPFLTPTSCQICSF